jgi:hypothetical protein
VATAGGAINELIRTSDMHSIVHAASIRFGEPPEYIKTAGAKDAEALRQELAKLPDSAFADSARVLPIHNKQAAWLSAAQFWTDALFSQGDPVVAAKLTKAASFWGIEEDVKSLMTKSAADYDQYTTAMPDQAFALVLDTPETGHLQRYPLLDEATVKAAAVDLEADRHLLPLPLRVRAASAIATKCAELKIEPSQYVKEASTNREEVATSSLEQAVSDRMQYIPMFSELREPLTAIRHSLKAAAATVTRPVALKVALALDAFDREFELYRRYESHQLATPEETIFRAVKKAEGPVKLITGREVPEDQLVKQGAAAFGMLPGYEYLTKAGKFDLDEAKRVIPTMPRDDARMFEQLLFA